MKTALISFLMLLLAANAYADDPIDFDVLWNYDDPAATEAAFREALADITASADLDRHAQLLTQIARTLGLQQRFDEAHAELDAVEAILTPETQVARIRYLLERGRVFNSSQEADQARALFVEAWELGREVGSDGFAVDAAHMLGIVESGEESLAWNLRALELAESSEDASAQRWKGSLLNNIGWTYHDAERFEEALDLFQRAQTFREAQGNVGTIRIARWCVGRALRSLERYDEALAIQQALQAEAETDDGYVYEELGELLLVLGQPEEAVPHFARAFELLSDDIWLTRDEPERLERLRELGRVSP